MLLSQPQWVGSTTAEIKLNLIYELLDDIMDVPRYEFTQFCERLLPYYKEIPSEAVLNDFQLMKRISNNFFNRIRDRNEQLSALIQSRRLEFVEKSTKEERKQIHDIVVGGAEKPKEIEG